MKERKIKSVVQSIRTIFQASSTGRVRRSLFLTGMAALAFTAQAAEQASAPGQPASGPAGDVVDVVDVVTVTARKTSELVQDVPMSISTIRSDQMLKENTTTLRDYFGKIPGLNVGRSGGRTDISIRGITTGNNANPTMAVTIDDSPFGSSTAAGGGTSMMPDIDPFDLQRIEVLRGPQGTLYGASNLGGLLKYVTTAPNTSVLSGRVQVDGSKVAHGGDGHGVRGAINIPVIKDRLGLRVSAFSRDDAGWLDNHTSGERDVNRTTMKGGRASLMWTPNEDLSVRASALHQKAEGKGPTFEAIDKNLKPLYGEYVAANMPGTGTYDRSIDFADLALTWDMHWATLTSTTSYGRLRFQGPQEVSSQFGGLLESVFKAPLGALATAPTSLNKKTQEIRLDSPEGAGKLDWRVGLFYTNEDAGGGQNITARNRTTAALAGMPLLIDTVAANQFRETAAFGVLTWHFSDQFDIQGGGRFSRNKQHFVSHSTGLLAPAQADVQVDSSESKSTYMLTPRYKVSKDLMVYGTVSTGYRPGGPNVSRGANIPTSYGADTTRNLELGAKGAFFNKMLQVDAAVFKIDWDNIQVSMRDAATGYSFNTNAGGAKSEGVELSGAFYPAAGWSITGNATYTRAVLTATTGVASNGRVGDRLPYSASRTAALSANKDFNLGSGWTAFGGISGNYVGDRYMTFGTSATAIRYRLPGYTTFGMTAGVRNKVWSVNAFVRNLGDKRGLLFTQDAGEIVPSAAFKNPQGQLTTINPRTVGVSVARSF